MLGGSGQVTQVTYTWRPAMGCAQWFERRVYMAMWRIRLGVRSEALRAKGETRRQQEMKEGFGVQL